MKCIDIDRHIDEFLNKQLVSGDLLAFEQHISICSECAKNIDASKALLSGLPKLPVPQPSADFKQRVFSEVRRQHKDDYQQQHRFRFLTGFATAAVASLAIWLVSSIYIPDTLIEQPQTISISMNEAQIVQLVFDSQSDIQQVNLSINLPDNMQLDGYPGRSELSWQTSLLKGQNILALPIIATGYGQGELHAELNYGDRVEIFRVLLKTTVDGVLRYQLDEYKSA